MTDPVADTRQLAAATRAVHAGERQELPRRPAVVPVYQTAPYLFSSFDELERAFAPRPEAGEEALRGLYSRYANPTVRVVEEKVAALEGAEDAVAFASGMGAISGVLSTLLGSGDRLLAAADLYGGTHAWLAWLADRHPEIAIDRAPLVELPTRLQGGAAPRVVYLETPTNPLVACGDIAEVARRARAHGALVVVDNTFASPVLQNPLALGADVVLHSATKFLAGHSDVTAGVVAGRRETMARVRRTMILGGACLDPHAAFLVARGIKTLPLRVERQSANAARLAAFLSRHPRVRRVFYPGDDPVGRAQMRAGGAMLAFELADDDGAAAATSFLSRLALFQIIPSLGGVESGVMIPALTSHRQLSRDERRALGIGEGLVRVSCGIEDGDDLERDLAHALEA